MAWCSLSTRRGCYVHLRVRCGLIKSRERWGTRGGSMYDHTCEPHDSARAGASEWHASSRQLKAKAASDLGMDEGTRNEARWEVLTFYRRRRQTDGKGGGNEKMRHRGRKKEGKMGNRGNAGRKHGGRSAWYALWWLEPFERNGRQERNLFYFIICCKEIVSNWFVRLFSSFKVCHYVSLCTNKKVQLYIQWEEKVDEIFWNNTNLEKQPKK